MSTQINSSNAVVNTFQNIGTLNLENGSGSIYIYGATSLDNTGTINLISNGAENLRPVNGGSGGAGQGPIIRNSLGGLIKSETDTETQTNNIQFLNAASGGAPVSTFQNLGTIEVTRGILRVYKSNVAYGEFLSATPTELTEGTYRIISTGTDRSMFDLDLIDPTDPNGGHVSGTDYSYTGTIVTIGANANLVLSSEEALGTTAGAQFPQLGAISSIDGSMYVHGMVDYDLASVANVSGTLCGDGSYTTTTSLTFQSTATLDPSALDGSGGSLNLTATDVVLNDDTQLNFFLEDSNIVGVNDIVHVLGNLTLDEKLTIDGPASPGIYTLFTYSGSLTDNGLALFGLPNGALLDLSTVGQVNLILPVPEPGTGFLSSFPALMLMKYRRRAHRSKA